MNAHKILKLIRTYHPDARVRKSKDVSGLLIGFVARDEDVRYECTGDTLSLFLSNRHSSTRVINSLEEFESLYFENVRRRPISS